MNHAAQQAHEIARTSYGKLLAIIAGKTGDISTAEDFLSHAYQRALECWPSDGVPTNAEAWLVKTAKNKFLDEIKSAAYRHRAPEETAMDIVIDNEDFATGIYTDKRLALMFACAHPAIDTRIHTPLILQTIFGFEAVFIATAFAIPAATMAQRLVRAKKKIKAARIPFNIPEQSEITERLDTILEAIYGAYSIGLNQGGDSHYQLGDEALYLTDILLRSLPEHAEVYGLAALLSYSVACKEPQIEYQALNERDTSQWNHALLSRADRLLSKAQSMHQLGQYQLEAAIFSVHADRRKTGITDYQAIIYLYDGLLQIAPTLGAIVARAVAVAEIKGWQTGLDILDNIDTQLTSVFQPYWAAKAYLYHCLGKSTFSQQEAEQAIALTTNVQHRKYLECRYNASIK